MRWLTVRAVAAGVLSWRLWYLGICWFLVETAIYGILFWTPLLLDALLTHNFDGTHPTTQTHSARETVSGPKSPPARVSSSTLAGCA